MKNIIKLSLIVSLTLIFSVKNSYAEYYMGGELTWECIPVGQPNAGKYIFSLKAYRNCAGIGYGSSQTINSTSPVNTIPVFLVSGWPKDISPYCNIGGFSGTGINEITCAGAGGDGNPTGAVSEYLFRSAPIQITGVPPANGWSFYWTSCCRPPVTNVNNGAGWKVRAKMYAYNNQNAYPCFDNSPTFAESPKPIIHAGYPTEYSNLAFDKELDSLRFEWGHTMASIYNFLSYSYGYSYNNPLPDVSENVNNVGAVMDSTTGMVSYTSYTTGYFLTSVKVSSYKNGQLVAEIWREIYRRILDDAASNTPPTVTINGDSVLQDTVFAGEIVSFPINGSDSSFLPDASSQMVELTAFSEQFGSYIPATGSNAATFSQTTGCLRPPCASLTPAPDPSALLASPSAVQSTFYWQTSLNHLLLDSNQNYLPHTYYFGFEFKDDYCPAPATKTTIASITIMPSLVVPQIESVVKDYSDITLKWSPIINDADSLFAAYYIYIANSDTANFFLIDSITNPNIGTYTYNYNLDPHMYFRIGLKQKFLGNNITFSNTVSNMVLSANGAYNCINELQWNSFCDTDENEYYRIYKKSPSNIWTLIDSTYSNNYVDTSLWDVTYYKVKSNIHQLYDSIGNITTTASETGVFSSFLPMNIGSDTSIYEDDSYYIITDFGFDTYEWQDGSSMNYYVVSGNNLGIGTHDIWLKATTLYGCEKADSIVVEVQELISIDDSKSDASFEVLPNPTDGKFNLEIKTSKAQKAELDIVSVNGETIYSSNVDLSIKKNVFRIDISNVAEGVYYIRLKCDKLNITRTITVIK